MLDPFVPLLSHTLSSPHTKVLCRTLHCLVWLLRLPLPSLETHIDPICVRLFELLRLYARAGMAAGSNRELVLSSFKVSCAGFYHTGQSGGYWQPPLSISYILILLCIKWVWFIIGAWPEPKISQLDRACLCQCISDPPPLVWVQWNARNVVFMYQASLFTDSILSPVRFMVYI